MPFLSALRRVVSERRYILVSLSLLHRTVEPEYAQVAGMMAAAFLVTGIFAGINFQVSRVLSIFSACIYLSANANLILNVINLLVHLSHVTYHGFE
jgi:hypothetical protein